ncbi:MAG TPA: bifunctional 4-hydroxy-2-oxoglutarate aldolase/2-dehydro-3-deoxy-phosphogluconate aldolase, partial [Longimicrobiaceae bacterium]
MNATEVQTALRSGGIIAIVRGNFGLERLRAIGESLAEGGVRALEVTLNSRSALEGIGMLTKALGPELLVGAGTVRTPGDVDAAIGAGARFLVSPNFDPASRSRSMSASARACTRARSTWSRH